MTFWIHINSEVCIWCFSCDFSKVIILNMVLGSEKTFRRNENAMHWLQYSRIACKQDKYLLNVVKSFCKLYCWICGQMMEKLVSDDLFSVISTKSYCAIISIYICYRSSCNVVYTYMGCWIPKRFTFPLVWVALEETPRSEFPKQFTPKLDCLSSKIWFHTSFKAL